MQGHVINISSIAASDHYAGGSIYCGTKAFVTAFTDSLRHDLVGTNIRCCFCAQLLMTHRIEKLLMLNHGRKG